MQLIRQGPLCFIQSSLNSCHYYLIRGFSLSLTLWVTWAGVEPLNPMISIELPGLFAIELSPVIRDESHRYPEPGDDILLEELDDVKVFD